MSLDVPSVSFRLAEGPAPTVFELGVEVVACLAHGLLLSGVVSGARSSGLFLSREPLRGGWIYYPGQGVSVLRDGISTLR